MTGRVGPDEVAARFDLDLDDLAICLACLSFVAFAIDDGDEQEIRRTTARMTPDIWTEGLALPARLALERARALGAPGADGALREAELFGGESAIARAIVRRLGAELSARVAESSRRLRRENSRTSSPECSDVRNRSHTGSTSKTSQRS